MSRITEAGCDRYGFLADLDTAERRWVECNARDLYEVETTLATIDAKSTDAESPRTP